MEHFKPHLLYTELPAESTEEDFRSESPDLSAEKAYRQHVVDRRRCYKPFALKTPVLLLFLSALVACVALLEFALHHGEKYTPLPSTTQTTTSPKPKLRRQTSVAESSASTSTSTALNFPTSTTSSSSGDGTFSATQSLFLSLSNPSSTTSLSVPSVTSATAPAVLLTLTSPTTSTSAWVTTITFGGDFTTTATAGTYTTEFHVTGMSLLRNSHCCFERCRTSV